MGEDAIERFKSAIWADIDRGAMRGLEEYLHDFPGLTEAIASEWVELRITEPGSIRHERGESSLVPESIG